jgi:hypothetical protein
MWLPQRRTEDLSTQSLAFFERLGQTPHGREPFRKRITADRGKDMLPLYSATPATDKRLRLFLFAIVLTLALCTVATTSFGQKPVTGQSFPKVPPGHNHMRLLLENAFRYVDPAHGIVDPVSGYPAEGWNQEPQNGLFLRSFTQLTAVGTWIELLANIVAGYADNPYLSRESAMSSLSLAVRNLLEDQRNPSLAAKGLLVNFLGLEGGKRTGPLLESIERKKFTDVFGEHTGHAVWGALVRKGWILEEDNGRKGRIRRTEKYGAAFFDGVLAPYAHDSLKSRIMGLLDQRVVTIIFGDNANLTASLAKSIGALLRPEIQNDPKIAALREEMERFIDLQKDGYSHLFDPKTGTFFFGWDATGNRPVGWDGGRGNWITGQMNYFINEFRGPWIFAVLRYGLPQASIRNAGFKIKPYRDGEERDIYALAAWEGSAFQLLGLSLFMQEHRNPAWRRNIETLVDIELDFSGRKKLPGFLSEAYSGNGVEYTGLIGISDLAVTDKPLITHAPSLYTLGVAYTIAPDKVEKFLGEHWSMISGLFTSHGPWEGWNTSRNEIIQYQTTVHTLSLILGGIGSAQENMHRYLEHRNLLGALEKLYQPGDRLDFLAAGNRVIPWTSDQSRFDFVQRAGSCRFASHLTGSGGMAFIAPEDRTLSLSNGRLVLRYRSEGQILDARISFNRAKDDPLPAPTIPVEVFTRFKATKEKEEAIEIVLPATPALRGIREVSLTFGGSQSPRAVDLSITAYEFIPFGFALDPVK